MNIFASFECPVKSAKYLDNKRLSKMLLESVQLLSTAVNLSANNQVAPYKSTHINHPATKWTAAVYGNYEWVLEHARALSIEYTSRFGKHHKCTQYLRTLTTLGLTYIPHGERTEFVNCTTYKNEKDINLAYRKYLNDKWLSDKVPPRSAI